MNRLITLIFIVLVQSVVFSQPTKPQTQKDTIIIRDTVVVIQQIPDSETVKTYQQILEKTNEQLSLWWNPYMLIIGILAIFFTLMTIIATIIIFTQSRGSKQLIKDSMISHKTALDNLISEKQKQLKLYETNIDNLIFEYNERLKSAGSEQVQVLTEIISKLENQKQTIDTQINSYEHGGAKHRDINSNVNVSHNTNFFARIKLNSINQSFVIYLRVLASDNKKYWLGFAGNITNTNYNTSIEFTRHQIYNTTEILIQENIVSSFNLGFKHLKLNVIMVDCVRLRGSDLDITPINFEFKFI